MQNSECKRQKAKWKTGRVLSVILPFAFSVLHFAVFPPNPPPPGGGGRKNQPIPVYLLAIAYSLFSVITYSTPLATTGVARILPSISFSPNVFFFCLPCSNTYTV